MGDYGSVWNFWPFLIVNASTTTYLHAQTPSAIVLCGVKGGKGNVFRGSLANPASDLLVFHELDTTTFSTGTNGFVLIAPPAGGMG